MFVPRPLPLWHTPNGVLVRRAGLSFAEPTLFVAQFVDLVIVQSLVNHAAEAQSLPQNMLLLLWMPALCGVLLKVLVVD